MALSSATGMVEIVWQLVSAPGERLVVRWTESGGPPVSTKGNTLYPLGPSAMSAIWSLSGDKRTLANEVLTTQLR